MATSQDKAIEYLENRAKLADDGINSDYFFSELKRNLPKDLEDAVRDIFIRHCDSPFNKQIGTAIGYEKSIGMIRAEVENYYSTLEYQHA